MDDLLFTDVDGVPGGCFVGEEDGRGRRPKRPGELVTPPSDSVFECEEEDPVAAPKVDDAACPTAPPTWPTTPPTAPKAYPAPPRAVMAPSLMVDRPDHHSSFLRVDCSAFAAAALSCRIFVMISCGCCRAFNVPSITNEKSMFERERKNLATCCCGSRNNPTSVFSCTFKQVSQGFDVRCVHHGLCRSNGLDS